MSPIQSSLARIKIKFPEDIWISQIFEDFHDIKMEISHFLPYDIENSIGNSVIEIQHYDIENIIDVIKNHPSVFEFSILQKEENWVKFNVKTKDPYLLYALIKCGGLVDFPVQVKEGYAYWRIIAKRHIIDDILSLFEEKGIDFQLLRIGNAPINYMERQDSLSVEEEKILTRAIEEGFFEVPRKISLEELANKVNKSKSSLSVMLRKIIKKKVMLSQI